MNAAQTHLISQLHLITEARGEKRGDWQFSGFEPLVLAHGRFMPWQPLPDGVQYQPVRQCFSNSQDLVFSRPELTYVEGYATHERLPLTVAHAWVVNDEGTVIDPTWRLEGGAYFGIAFDSNWLLDFLSDRVSRGKISHRAVLEGNFQDNVSFLREGLPQKAFAEPEMALPIKLRAALSEENQPRS